MAHHPKAKRDYPNGLEQEFLDLAYNRFFNIFEFIFTEGFWENEPNFRFGFIKDAIAVYAELLHYEPIKWYHDFVKTERPPMEAELSSDFARFIRNVILHFPFYDTWDEVYINKKLVNWQKPNQTIDQFLNKYAGHPPVKYRYFLLKSKEMRYVEIRFPIEYDDSKLYLKDFVSDKEGIEFLLLLMHKSLIVQIESIEPPLNL